MNDHLPRAFIGVLLSWIIFFSASPAYGQSNRRMRKRAKPEPIQTVPSSESDLILTAIVREALEWRFVITAGGYRWSYHTKSLKRLKGGLVRVWIRRQAIEGKQYSVSFTEYSCPRMESRTLSTIDYDASRQVVSSRVWGEKYSTWNYVVPVSIDEMLLEAVCNPPR